MTKRAYKTEVVLNEEQTQKYRQTVGVCRYVYNMFVEINEELYDLYKGQQPYMNSNEFSKWLNNGYKESFPDESWIYDVSSKAVRRVIDNADAAYKSFMKGEKGFPNRKKKFTNDCTMYFVRSDKEHPIKCDRHRIFIPTLGWVKIKEKGYIPYGTNASRIISGTLSYHGGRYFVSVTVEETALPIPEKTSGEPIGVDLGITNFVSISDGRSIPNFNKISQRIRFLERKLKRLNREAARRRDSLSTRRKEDSDATCKNLGKTYDAIRKVNYELDCLRDQFILDAVHEIVRTKPSHVSIEDLNVRGMMKNKHLAKHIQRLRFYEFRVKLIAACNRAGIEVRLVDRWFASSKTCSACGAHKDDLKLSERVFHCPECGHVVDRDLNAALNLRDALEFSVVT